MLRLDHAYTDVVEEFKYDSFNEQYNMAFLEWRRNTDSQYVFRFSDNSLENVYVSGAAGAKQDAGIAERESLMRCSQLIGAALLICFVAQMAGGSLLAGLLRLFGIDLHVDFLSISKSGSQWAVVAAKMVVVLLKYLFPTVLLIKAAKLPRRVFAPFKSSSVPMVTAGIGAGMFIAGIYALIAQQDGIQLAQEIYTYKDTDAIAAYGIFDALLAAALAELFLRGTVQTLLRQFGDPFAVGITACIAFLFPNSLPDRMGELLIGLTAGYLLVRTGSIATCILVRMTYAGLNYARLVAVYTSRTMQLWEYALLLISIGTLALAFYVLQHRHALRMSNRRIVLSDRKKCSALVLTVTMLPWLAVSTLLTLLQCFY